MGKKIKMAKTSGLNEQVKKFSAGSEMPIAR